MHAIIFYFANRSHLVFVFDLNSNRFVICKGFENRKVFSILEPGPRPFPTFSLKPGPSGSLFIFPHEAHLAYYSGPAPLPFPFYFFPSHAAHISLPQPVSQPVFPMHHAPPDGPAIVQGRRHCSPHDIGTQDRRKYKKIFPNGIVFESR
jgi:hypothetical protein